MPQESELERDRFMENVFILKVTYLTICYSFFFFFFVFFLEISNRIATPVIDNFTELFPITNVVTQLASPHRV